VKVGIKKKEEELQQMKRLESLIRYFRVFGQNKLFQTVFLSDRKETFNKKQR
jgi:hypothetical protein